MEESKRKVPYSQGQALADEFGIQFFETSAKNNIKVDEVCSCPLPACSTQAAMHFLTLQHLPFEIFASHQDVSAEVCIAAI